jgi:rhodanese-related sulfurtransferase
MQWSRDGKRAGKSLRPEVAIEEDTVVLGGAQAIQDIPVREAWEKLKTDPAAIMIDVRTRAEWTFVGLPDLSSVGKRIVTVEWQTFPENSVDPAFSQRLKAALAGHGAESATPMYFICRSGGRSRMAAEAMAALGYQHCFNVADGFEGPLDAERHRGRIGGWKAAGLAWTQG